MIQLSLTVHLQDAPDNPGASRIQALRSLDQRATGFHRWQITLTPPTLTLSAFHATLTHHDELPLHALLAFTSLARQALHTHYPPTHLERALAIERVRE